MLAIERQRAIIAALSKQRSVKVNELAVEFEVAEETIRRDLDKLESEGKLVRSHGGAVAALEMEQPHWQREFVNQAEKSAIAREAIKMINPGDTIILDASSTCWFVASRLPKIPLTVITNSLYVCMALEGREDTQVINPGGVLMDVSMSFAGVATLQVLRRYHAAKLFFSCRALDLERGLSDISEEQASVRHVMMEISDQRILLLDGSKWGTRALSLIGPCASIHHVITDGSAPAASIEALRGKGVQVTVAEVYQRELDRE
ncbi:MAG TPA: DeoR/GlpR family DNA-binding transcription regulator [Kiritimatiellia bacterium]|nr:DeoR/GlpR family DNA-binding transcription regulator [Kiritimatiellia bacterium]HMO98348.1 DeoR/GlpR family DNA-binding transcription regulator [Kiritimatiellia bacterium]HMP95456.1 DeoR/GlpR family DNA-binding transcription regulator [Kiritimatiellia bacterium]